MLEADSQQSGTCVLSNTRVPAELVQSATNEALTHNLIVTQMASSLNTPHLPTRKLLVDLLSFLAYWNDGEAHSLVVAALEALSSANGERGGCYDYWFKSMELSLSGRGKMGSLVGASDEVKKTGGIDTNLNEYAVHLNLLDLILLLTFTRRSPTWYS